MSWFYGSSLIANATGSLFAAGVIAGLDGVHGVPGWRYARVSSGLAY